MKTRTILTLVVIAIALLLIVLYPYIEKNLFPQKKENKAGGIDLTHLKKDGVKEIIIDKGENGSLKLISDDGWKVGGYMADKQEIDDFFRELHNTRIGSMVSKNRANHQSFNVDDKHGYKLTIVPLSDKTEKSFIIGNEARGFDSFYIRKAGDDRVYIAHSRLRRFLENDLDSWRDKTVLNLSKEGLSIIKIRYPDSNTITLRSEDGKGWRYVGRDGKGTDVSEDIMSRLFNTISPLRAVGFVHKDKDIKRFKDAKNKTLVEFIDRSGKKITHLSLLKDKGEWLGMVEGKDEVYRIPSYRVESLLIKESDLKKKGEKKDDAAR